MNVSEVLNIVSKNWKGIVRLTIVGTVENFELIGNGEGIKSNRQIKTSTFDILAGWNIQKNLTFKIFVLKCMEKYLTNSEIIFHNAKKK
ncbi:hypothetical protein HNY73_005736 [Argiope bruennichi]|uniref:Uncharacterized protein n=1 Tax=Argiope bruennichi TaxID=94029 RepID=A0A8T0FK50_ARGBR|nr:hypothetical protein HNY73_005736 [Argiope bruennichi]